MKPTNGSPGCVLGPKLIRLNISFPSCSGRRRICSDQHLDLNVQNFVIRHNKYFYVGIISGTLHVIERLVPGSVSTVFQSFKMVSGPTRWFHSSLSPSLTFRLLLRRCDGPTSSPDRIIMQEDAFTCSLKWDTSAPLQSLSPSSDTRPLPLCEQV